MDGISPQHESEVQSAYRPASSSTQGAPKPSEVTPADIEAANDRIHKNAGKPLPHGEFGRQYGDLFTGLNTISRQHGHWDGKNILAHTNKAIKMFGHYLPKGQPIPAVEGETFTLGHQSDYHLPEVELRYNGKDLIFQDTRQQP